MARWRGRPALLSRSTTGPHTQRIPLATMRWGLEMPDGCHSQHNLAKPHGGTSRLHGWRGDQCEDTCFPALRILRFCVLVRQIKGLTLASYYSEWRCISASVSARYEATEG